MAQKIDIIRQLKRSLDNLDLDSVRDMELEVKDISSPLSEGQICDFCEQKPIGVEMKLKVYWKGGAK